MTVLVYNGIFYFNLIKIAIASKIKRIPIAINIMSRTPTKVKSSLLLDEVLEITADGTLSADEFDDELLLELLLEFELEFELLLDPSI